MTEKVKREFAVMVHKDNCKKTLIRQIISFLILGLFIYVSRDSAWWTLVTGALLVLSISVWIKNIMDENHNEFTTKKDLLEWANNFDDD